MRYKTLASLLVLCGGSFAALAAMVLSQEEPPLQNDMTKEDVPTPMEPGNTPEPVPGPTDPH